MPLSGPRTAAKDGDLMEAIALSLELQSSSTSTLPARPLSGPNSRSSETRPGAEDTDLMEAIALSRDLMEHGPPDAEDAGLAEAVALSQQLKDTADADDLKKDKTDILPAMQQNPPSQDRQ